MMKNVHIESQELKQSQKLMEMDSNFPSKEDRRNLPDSGLRQAIVQLLHEGD